MRPVLRSCASHTVPKLPRPSCLPSSYLCWKAADVGRRQWGTACRRRPRRRHEAGELRPSEEPRWEEEEEEEGADMLHIQTGGRGGGSSEGGQRRELHANRLQSHLNSVGLQRRMKAIQAMSTDLNCINVDCINGLNQCGLYWTVSIWIVLDCINMDCIGLYQYGLYQ